MYNKSFSYLVKNKHNIISVGQDVDKRGSFVSNRIGLFFFLIEHRYKNNTCVFSGQKLYWAISTSSALKKAKRDLIFKVIDKGCLEDANREVPVTHYRF
jgi:hypothetical protein